TRTPEGHPRAQGALVASRQTAVFTCARAGGTRRALLDSAGGVGSSSIAGSVGGSVHRARPRGSRLRDALARRGGDEGEGGIDRRRLDDHVAADVRTVSRRTLQG